MDFLTNIHSKRNTLTKSELKVCDLILENLIHVQRNSFSELAERIDMTKPTILRFCQKIGYSGYNEFKYECIKYVNSTSQMQSVENEPIEKIEKIVNKYHDILKLLPKFVKDSEMTGIVERIRSARRIRIVGVVNSSVSAWQLHYALLMFGIETSVFDSEEKLHTIDMCVQEEDLFLIYSVGAKSSIVKYAYQLAESGNAKTILITMNPDTEYLKRSTEAVVLPSITNLKSQSLLDSVPILAIFNEILIYYLSL